MREASGSPPADRTGAPRLGTVSDLNREATSVHSDPAASRPLTRRQSATAFALTSDAGPRFESLTAEESEAPLSADSASSESGEADSTRTITTADAAERAALAEESETSSEPESRGVNRTGTETYEENGVTYTRETRSGARGQQSTTTTYEIDGVQYTEVETQGPNGTTIRVEAVNGDRTEVSETRTQSVPGDLENYLPEGYVEGIDFDRDAARGATRRTSESTTVIDNSQDPPVVTVTSESTTYSQEVASGLPNGVSESSDGDLIRIHHGANDAPYTTAIYGEVEFDPEASGQTISYTEATALDAEGNSRSSTSLSSETRLVGQGEDGQEVLISTRSDRIVDDQGRSSLILTNQTLGAIPADSIHVSDIYTHTLRLHDGALLERLQGSQGPWLDLRETTVYTDGGPPLGVTTSEFGELDREGDSRSLTVVRDGETESHTYRLVSEGGDRIQTQTQVPGTDYNAVTDLQHGPDGTFTSTSETTFNGEVIASSSASRELIYPAGQALPSDPPEGFNRELWEQFRAENPNGPVFRDQVESMSRDEEGTEEVNESFAYQGSNAQIGQVLELGPKGSQRWNQFFAADGPDPRATIRASDGTVAEISSNGEIWLDGVSQVGNLGLQIGSGNQALRTLIDELGGASYTPSRLNRALGPLGVALGGFDLIRADNNPDRVLAAGGLLGGAGSSIELLGTAGRVGRLAKGAGIAGGVLTGGVGVYELFQGEYAKGTADVIAGGATIAAVLLLSSNPVGAAIAGTIAVGASVVRLFLDNEEPPEQPDWAF